VTRKPLPKVFATMAFAAALMVAAGALAWYSGSAADRFMPKLNLERPAIAQAPLTLPPAAGSRLSRRLVLIMIDGLRLDTSYGRPFLDGLRARGVAARASASFPSFSHPGYVALLTGVPPRESGVRNNQYPWVVPLDNLMRRARAAGLKVAYLSPDDDGVPRLFPHDFDAGAIAPWQGGFEQAVRGVLASDAELVLLWIVDVDHAGHQFGAATPEYRTAAREVDATLGRLFADFDFAHDTIVVTADHGHIDRGGHGGLEPEVLDVPLIIAGAGVQPGVTLVDARQIDVAPTLAGFLGVPAPAQALGRTLVSALTLTPDARLRIAATDASRWASLQGVLARDRARSTTVGDVIGSQRAAGLAILLVLAFGVVTLAVRWQWIALDRRVLLIAVPAFPLTFYSMIVEFENWLSPSMMPARGSIVSKLFSYGAVAALVHLVAAWVSLVGRPNPHARLAAAAGITATGLLVALAPVGVAWRLASPVLAHALPEPRLLMLAPVVYAAVAAYALSAMLTLLVEYAVFMARVTGR
jgi:hypothetical protein